MEASHEPLQAHRRYRLFLQQLIQARTDAGVTQEELAQRLELSPQMVARYESGARQIDLVQTMEWCQALGVTFLDFMVKLDREITAQLPDADANVEQEGGAQ